MPLVMRKLNFLGPSSVIGLGFEIRRFVSDLNPHLLVPPVFGRNVPRTPRLGGGVKGHNINETSSSGSPALWAGSFTTVSRKS